MAGLTQDQITAITALPALTALIASDEFPVGRVGAPAPAYQCSLTVLAAAIAANLPPTGVVPGTYSNPTVTVNAAGDITTIVNGSVTQTAISFETLGGTTLGSAEAMGGWVAPFNILFAANFAAPPGAASGAVGHMFDGNSANPAATMTCIIAKNGTQVGTMVISTSGVYSFTTSGGATVSMVPGDRLTFVGPNPPDANAFNFLWTIVGTPS